MNKRVLTILIINLAIVMLAVLILIISSDKEQIYDTADVRYLGGMHDDVWRDGKHILYTEDIKLENTSDYNLSGYVIADIKRESDYVKEEYVYAYDINTGEKLLVTIPANSTIELRGVHFRATSISDAEALRSDREPLSDVKFVEVEREAAGE